MARTPTAPSATHYVTEGPAPLLPTDSLDLYLQEIGRVPLLSAAEEVELAQQIERGREAERRLAADECDLALRRALQADVEHGADARRRLIQANLRLVVSVAKRYARGGQALLDLIQEGNIGLLRAVEKFDYRQGHKFSTYAVWWIRQAVRRAQGEQITLIRLPAHLGEAVPQIRHTMMTLEQALGRPPTQGELASALNLSEERIARLLDALRPQLSLEKPIGDEEGRTLGETIQDEQPSEVDNLMQRFLRNDLEQALEQLSERERQVLALRYGLADGERHTLSAIGAQLGITRERARQIESNALRTLRSSESRARLRVYLDS